MIVAYARVSTKEQNLDRQINEFKKLGIEKIVCEKQSGKDFESRKIYQALKKRLKENDELVISSIDRLGRNYEQILNEWRYLSQKKVYIRVLDMPILNTKTEINGLDSRFISDLVLQILAYVSEKEREKIKERQRQGIESAMAKGVRFGRPKKRIESTNGSVDDVFRAYKLGQITCEKALEYLNISRTQFFRLTKQLYYKGQIR